MLNYQRARGYEICSEKWKLQNWNTVEPDAHTHTLQTRIYDTAWTIPTRCTLEVQTSNLWDDAWNNLNFTTTTDHRYHAWPWWTYPHSWPWHPRSIQGRRPCFWALGWGHLQKPEKSSGIDPEPGAWWEHWDGKFQASESHVCRPPTSPRAVNQRWWKPKVNHVKHENLSFGPWSCHPFPNGRFLLKVKCQCFVNINQEFCFKKTFEMAMGC